MKVIGLVNKDSGPGFHRILMPLLLMPGVDAYITNSVKEEDFHNCDWIYYNRNTGDDIVKLRHKYKYKIAVDIDDYWDLDYHHILYQYHSENDGYGLQVKHLRLADVVTTTHERLAEMVYPHNKNVVVCPNAIPDHEYFNIERTVSDMVRIFWQGSITHEKDLEMIRGPFRRLDKKKFMSVIAGYHPEETWDKMVASFTDNLRLPGSILPGTSPFEYYKNYQFADICVAPLLKSRFNSFKSNLKILEAAHAGVPVVASYVHPYLEMPVLYAQQQTDWFKHINSLGNSKSMRDDIGLNLKEYCNRNFNFNRINEVRKSIFI